MAEENGDATVRFTVKELLAQADERADERAADTLKAIDALAKDVAAVSKRVDALQTNVEAVAAAAQVKDALERDRGVSKATALGRRDRFVLGLSVGSSIIIGIVGLALSAVTKL